MDIILASSSPRRKKILQKLGYNFIIKVPNINEDNTSKLNPIDYVIDVSMRKGLKVHQQYENAFVLSGDTIVEFQNKIIGKPSSYQDAFEVLSLLSFNISNTKSTPFSSKLLSNISSNISRLQLILFFILAIARQVNSNARFILIFSPSLKEAYVNSSRYLERIVSLNSPSNLKFTKKSILARYLLIN